MKVAIWAVALALLFGVYITGITTNPPGFYIDESGFCYTAFLVSKTGGEESGRQWPLFFQFYTGGYAQYTAPTLVYLLALAFTVLGPSILLARLVTAASMFAGCVSVGFLGARISGRKLTGIVIGSVALLTPWLFEVGRLVLDTFFYPTAVVLFLWAVYLAQKKDKWNWVNCLAITLALVLVTYSYTIGRLLGPMLAFGLISFATSKARIFSIVRTWLAYSVTMIPLIVFLRWNPDFTTRFYLLSYIKPESTWTEVFLRFVSRFFEELNPAQLLLRGDINPRHHIPDALGSFFIAAFILSMIGIIVVVIRHWRDPWWRYVIFGLLVSLVPGALTVDEHHTLRAIAAPVFLIILMIPAIEWMLGRPNDELGAGDATEAETGGGSTTSDPRFMIARRVLLAVLLVGAMSEAVYFHYQYFERGSLRGYVFDAAYKDVYDAAVAEPQRPIYLEDGYWGPDYIHSYWYATVEGRSASEFVHQPYGRAVPEGAIVISSNRDCTRCEIILRKGDFILYRSSSGP